MWEGLLVAATSGALRTLVTQAMFWLLIMALVIGIAVVVVRKFREQIDEDEHASSELLTNFREMHGRGGLSDAEFRTIKTALGARLQQESKRSTDKG